MSTVVARLEPSRNNPDIGTVYYRIYKGHNRRLEFSSRLRLACSLWDKTARTVVGDSPEICRIRTQMEADLDLMNRIVSEDTDGTQRMSELAAAFKQRRKLL